MKLAKKIFLIAIIFISVQLLESCAGTRVAAGVGVNVHFGPNGPRVTPNFNVGLYNGGYYY